MAVTISDDLELLDLNELLGVIPAGNEPLHTLLRRINWCYATHAPALISCAPMENPVASFEIIVPVYPSADDLTYNASFAVYAASTGTVDVDVEEATTYAGAYTRLSGYPQTMASITAGNTGVETFDAGIDPTTRFLRITAENGAGNVQLQGFLAAPKKLSSLPSSPTACGVNFYDDAALAAAGPIHTEYFLRIQEAIRAIYSDRRQCLFSLVQTTGTPRHGFTSSGPKTTYLAGLAGYHMPDPSSEVDVTVYARIYDSGGSPGELVVGQVGNPTPVTLAADDTSRSGTLTLLQSAPSVIYVLAKNPGGTMYPRYVTVEWTPSIGSTTPIVGGVAPAPLRGFIAAADQLSKEACLRPYAGAGLVIDSGRAGGTNWYHLAQVGPGVKALQPYVTISRDNLTGAGSPAEFWTSDSGASPSDKILVESPQGGSIVFPPKEWAEISTTQGWDDTPAAATYRMCEISSDREPKLQAIWGRYYAGWGYRSLRYYPPESLPG